MPAMNGMADVRVRLATVYIRIRDRSLRIEVVRKCIRHSRAILPTVTEFRDRSGPVGVSGVPVTGSEICWPAAERARVMTVLQTMWGKAAVVRMRGTTRLRVRRRVGELVAGSASPCGRR